MSEIRYLQPSDMPQVIALFQKIFRDPQQPPPAALASYLHHIFIDFPGEAKISSKVLADPAGTITGFIGIHCFDYHSDGQVLKAAMAGALMVDNHQHDPLSGARLMRSLLDDGYDLILTETASETTAAMWKKLNAVQLPNYSLDWLRMIRPLGFALETAAAKFSPLGLLTPLANSFDNRKRSAMPANQLRWSATPQHWPAANTLHSVPIDRDEFITCYQEFAAQFSARPLWQPQQLSARLADALQKPGYGTAHLVKTTTRTGKTVGLFFYHLQPGKTARVLELFSAPKAWSQTIDALIHHAASHGAVAIRGRTQPQMMEAMLGKRIAFTHLASTMVWARQTAMLHPFVQGSALVNGLSGEYWSRFTGNDFDESRQ